MQHLSAPPLRALALVAVLATLTTCGEDEPLSLEAPPAPLPLMPVTQAPEHHFVLALVGDQGLGARARSLLALVRRRADALVVVGDFDYADSPESWVAMLNDELGQDFPWFAVVGNHDVPHWKDYQRQIADHQRGIRAAHCSGRPGEDERCSFEGVDLLFSAIGTLPDPSAHEEQLRQALSLSQSRWKLCLWHKNQHDLQVGTKPDEVGWTSYRLCQAAGALIVNGHEHSYARTRTLSALGDRAAHHGALGDDEHVYLSPGTTAVIVNGMGGKSLRALSGAPPGQPWWASWYTSDSWKQPEQRPARQQLSADSALLLLTFEGKDSRVAKGELLNADSAALDHFELVAAPPP